MDIIWSGHLVGTFHGYKPGRIYVLSDGSEWTQEDLTDEPVYRGLPTSRETPGSDGASPYRNHESPCRGEQGSNAGSPCVGELLR